MGENQWRLKTPPHAVLQFCICCIGFQDQLLPYVESKPKSTHVTFTLRCFHTIVWFMNGISFIIIALICPVKAISELPDFPSAYDLGFFVIPMSWQ